MNQHTGHGQWNIEVQQAIVTENMGRINELVQERSQGASRRFTVPRAKQVETHNLVVKCS